MASVRTLSQLPELKDLTNETLFNTAQPQKMDIDDDDNKFYYYQSRKVKMSSLMDFTIDVIHDDLDRKNGLGDNNIQEHQDAIEALSTGGTEKNPVLIQGVKHFEKAAYIDESLSSFDTSVARKAVSVNTLSNYVFLNAAPNMTSAFGFVTHLSSNSENESIDRYLQLIDDTKESNPYQFGLTQDSKKLIQNEYIFKINPGETESNEWMAPASGMFTCYGWLDERQNDIINNSNRWVALMAMNTKGNVAGKWFILQVQPFIKNKYLSYVGFSFPVSLGLRLKIKIGFEAGSNSDKYYNVNGGLANHVPNAFFGGVYTGSLTNKAIKVDFTDMPHTGLPNSEAFDEYYASKEKLDELKDVLCAEAAEHNRKDGGMSSIIDDLSVRLFDLSSKIAAISPEDDTGKFNSITAQLQNLSSMVNTKVSLVNQDKRTSSNQKQSVLRLMKNMNDAAYTGWSKIYSVDRWGSDGKYKYYDAGAARTGQKTIDGFIKQIDKTAASNPATLSTERLNLQTALGASQAFNGEDELNLEGRIWKKYDAAGNQSLLGHWYMDDNFFYYKIYKNSTVRILLYPDCLANQTITDCYLIHYQTENNVIHRKYTMLGRATEMLNGMNDDPTTITIPLSAGTELAFAAWFLPLKVASGVAVSGATSSSSYSAASKKKSLTTPNNSNLSWTNAINLRVAPDGTEIKSPSLTLKVSCEITEAHDKGGTVHYRVVNSSGTVIAQSKSAGSAKNKTTVNGSVTWKPADFTASKITPVITVQCCINGVNHSSTSSPQTVTAKTWIAKFSGSYTGNKKNSAPINIDDYNNMPWALPVYSYGDLSTIVANEKAENAASGQGRYSLVHPKDRNARGANIDGTRIIAWIHELYND